MTLRLGTLHLVYWKNKYHPAEIVEKRLKEGSNTLSDYEYYVHYVDSDRRLDEWVASNQINPTEITANELSVEEEIGNHPACKEVVPRALKRQSSHETKGTEQLLKKKQLEPCKLC